MTHLALSLIALFSTAVHAVNGQCKPRPGSSGWPSDQDWQTLNQTINGKLLAPLPPAIVCDSARPEFNNASCTDLIVSTKWFNSSFHADHPSSVDWPNWQNDGCIPPIFTKNVSTPCDTTAFPAYVVAAESGDDVAAAVKFAAKSGVRLVVKATGHDFLGRSTAPGALSIYTQGLRGLQVHQSFTSSSCPKAGRIPAMTIAAGERMRSLYAEAAKNNVWVIGGSDPNVGIGGWLTGGGHSPVSGSYGLGVDNTLEMKVVTPSGDIVTANECENPDLYWAFRGGGGSTFGVLLEVTVKTYPMPQASSIFLNFNSTPDEAEMNNNDNFFNITAFLYTQLPALTEVPIMGYSFIFKKSTAETQATGYAGAGDSAPNVNTKEPMLFFWGATALDKSTEDIYKVFAPFLARLNSTQGVENIFVVAPPVPYYEAWRTTPDGTVGVNSAITSRLWDAEAVKDQNSVFNTLHKYDKSGGLQGLVVSGPAVRNKTSDSASVTPAWRKTQVHVLAASGWAYQNATAQKEGQKLITELGKPLRDQAPDSGAYINEADINEPDHQHAFWGSNYERLLRIKRQVDPNGVFWCKACVGGEDWKEENGQVCKVSGSETNSPVVTGAAVAVKEAGMGLFGLMILLSLLV